MIIIYLYIKYNVNLYIYLLVTQPGFTKNKEKFCWNGITRNYLSQQRMGWRMHEEKERKTEKK